MRLFYCIGEFTNVESYCRHMGLKPHKVVMKSLDGDPFPEVVQYTKGGYIYDVLGDSQCYSGYMVTLMRLPKLSFPELLEVAITSCDTREREGAIGMILKEYEREFVDHLIMLNDNGISDRRYKKGIARVVRYILGYLREYCSYVKEMEKVLYLCEQISIL